MYPEGREQVSTKTKVFIGFGIYFGITAILLLVLGSEGKNEGFEPQNEFKLDPWIDLEHRRDRRLDQQGRLLPGRSPPC